MKKIIIPFDGNHFSKGAFSLARRLNEASPVLLTGVFLPEVDYAKIFFLPAEFAGPSYVPVIENFEEETVEKNISEFVTLSQKYKMQYKVHRDLKNAAITQLTKETRFADLMIIGAEVFYTEGVAGPFEYLKDALHHAECPVMIVPEKFKYPSQLVLAYDGSESSVYAIKQFVYLFPEMCKLNSMLVYIGDEKHAIPESVLIEEYASAHFEKLAIRKVHSEHYNTFDQWLNEHWNPLLVSGSFGRSGVSALFKKSFVLDIIREHKTSVFIAHQ